MKHLFKILLLGLTALVINACGEDHYKREYRMSEDGLIYKTGTNELYTGIVQDTSDVIITFEVVNGVKNGAFITFYLNGNYEKYGLVENDKNTGIWSYFYPDGQLESTGSFNENAPDGKWISYYPNGKLKTEGEYFKGEQHGQWKYYNEKGELVNVYLFGFGELLESRSES